MKKRVLGVIALVMLLVLPFVKVNADAAGGVVASTADKSTAITDANSTFISSSNSFSGSFELSKTNETITLYSFVLDGKTIPSGYVISGTVNFSSSSYVISACEAITSTTNYSVTCTAGSDGKSATFKAVASKDIAGEKKTKIATLNIDSSAASSTDNCVVTLEISGEQGDTPVTPKCSANEKDGIYTDDKGNQVTKEEYEKACTSENPQTGSAVSYVIIVGGIALAVAAFMMTKKSKIYNV